jgi:GNAT superfamily N-acetyltransferase
MELAGPLPDTSADCERILRSLPRWFGIEEFLLEYVRDSDRFPTFHALENGRSVGFATVREHFRESWEVHCIGMLAEKRGQGIGKALHAHVERWLQERGVLFLQVKTLADSHPSKEYAETRAFYASLGYKPMEVFPTLWGPRLPVLQLVKYLAPLSNAA